MLELHRSPWFNLEGYLVCTARYDNGSKKTIYQHREVMEIHIGRTLLSSEIVHHRDEDKRNNCVGNLELTDHVNHATEHAKSRSIEMVSFTCPQCDSVAEKQARFVRHNKRQGKAGPFCSRSCAGKWSAIV